MPATANRLATLRVLKRANTIKGALNGQTKSHVKWNSEKSNDGHERNDDDDSENCQTTVLFQLANSLIKI